MIQERSSTMALPPTVPLFDNTQWYITQMATKLISIRETRFGETGNIIFGVRIIEGTNGFSEQINTGVLTCVRRWCAISNQIKSNAVTVLVIIN